MSGTISETGRGGVEPETISLAVIGFQRMQAIDRGERCRWVRKSQRKVLAEGERSTRLRADLRATSVRHNPWRGSGPEQIR